MTQPVPVTAVVLCGGKGTRLAPWPAPKCLLPVNGKPIIHRIIDQLEAAGVEKIVIAIGYRGQDVVTALDGRNVYFSNAGEEAGMGRRIKEAYQEHTSGGRLLVCYGDELADVSIPLLLAGHQSAKALMTLTVHEMRFPFGVVPPGGKVDDNFRARVNIGFAVVEPPVFDAVEFRPESQAGLSDIYNHLFDRSPKLVAEYVHSGRRATVNSLSELELAEEVFA